MKHRIHPCLDFLRLRSLALFFWVFLVGVSMSADALEQGFARPPAATKPWVYWYWITDNLSAEGITRDLESMAAIGIGEAFIGNIFLDGITPGPVKVLTPAWWTLVTHAIREGGRLGVNIGMFNCPGWSQSGGPWIAPSDAMRYLTSSETRVTGPKVFKGVLPVPRTPFQDVAVLAFPEPAGDDDVISAHAPQIECEPLAANAGHLVDGRLDKAFQFPGGKGPVTLTIRTAKPMTAQSLLVYPAKRPFQGTCRIQAAAVDGSFRTLRTFRVDRSNMKVNVGPMPRGPAAVSFPAVVSDCFRLVWTGVERQSELAEIVLSAAPKLDFFVEKQLGKMHPTPLPKWDSYLWPKPREPRSHGGVTSPGKVIDLSDRCDARGRLQWNVPPGRWVILRIGMTPTGTRNAPSSPEGEGLEVDKMNRRAAKKHFDAFIGQLLSRMPEKERTAFKRVVADSYEMGSQNWTDGFAPLFQQAFGYDPAPWLPVLTGRLVGSADQSDRFLWDLRRLVADRIAEDYVGGLRDLCREKGLQLWLENYGHWGFPGEFLKYGGQSHRLGGEFWATGNLGSIECRCASSAANIYGMPVVSAEAFTGGPAFRHAPSALKARGDWAFCEGINHFVLHVYIHQPWEDRKPGMNAWFGTEFNRHNTWFSQGKAWVDYLRRCCFMLQQGGRVADVAYFIGEDTPKMSGPRKPALPRGRDFDDINAEVLCGKAQAGPGCLTLPHGPCYRVLVLPDQPTMRPQVLARIAALVKQGAVVLGKPPERSPSLQDYPGCDARVRELARVLWGEGPLPARGRRKVGEGLVVWGESLKAFFEAQGLPTDFDGPTSLLYTHRKNGETDIYFVSNQTAQTVSSTLGFRVTGKAPECFWPETGRLEKPAVYRAARGVVRMPLVLAPQESVFVVFRKPASASQRSVASVARNGAVIQSTAPAKEAGREEAGATGDGIVKDNFALACWVRPSADTTLHEETNRGVRGMAETRNDVIFPPHGDTFSPDGNGAGCGLAVGRNGVCVFEHGANYFVPILVHPVALQGWHHVAVVYRRGRPSLFLNGRPVHTGLQSGHTVFAAVQANAGFQGRLGRISLFAEALTMDAVLKLSKAMPRPERHVPAAALAVRRLADDGLTAEVRAAGDYLLEMADGRTLSFAAEALPNPVALQGPWQVRFKDAMAGEKAVTFPALMDWRSHPMPFIRHFAGQAIYACSVDLPGMPGTQRCYLNLGRVHDIASVRINGRKAGTLWKRPWRLDVSSFVRSGENSIQVTVANVWHNRLVHEASLPAEKRTAWLSAQTVDRKDKSLPAGLLGPVSIEFTRILKLR